MQSLLMMISGDSGAHERSGPEYKEMLKAHGFVEVQTKETQGIWLDAIHARKLWWAFTDQLVLVRDKFYPRVKDILGIKTHKY